MECINCEGQQVVTFEMAYLSGTSEGELSGQMSGLAYSPGYGFSPYWGDVRGSVSNRTHLAALTAPPPKPSPGTLFWVFIFGILFGAVNFLFLSFAPALFGTTGGVYFTLFPVASFLLIYFVAGGVFGVRFWQLLLCVLLTPLIFLPFAAYGLVKYLKVRKDYPYLLDEWRRSMICLHCGAQQVQVATSLR